MHRCEGTRADRRTYGPADRRRDRLAFANHHDRLIIGRSFSETLPLPDCSALPRALPLLLPHPQPQPPPPLGDWVDGLQPAKRLQPHLGFELRRMNSAHFLIQLLVNRFFGQ